MNDYTFAAILRKTDELDKIANSRKATVTPVYKKTVKDVAKQETKQQRNAMKRKQ